MVTIDGTDISGVTIDGEEVQEITADGDVVWSATEQVLVADWEDGSKSISNSDYNGLNDDTSNVFGSYSSTVVSSPTISGSYTYEQDTTNSNGFAYYNYSTTDTKTQTGIEFKIRATNGTPDAGNRAFVGVRDGSNGTGNILVRFELNDNGDVELLHGDGSGNHVRTILQTWSGDTDYQVRINWERSVGEITSVVIDGTEYTGPWNLGTTNQPTTVQIRYSTTSGSTTEQLYLDDIYHYYS